MLARIHQPRHPITPDRHTLATRVCLQPEEGQCEDRPLLQAAARARTHRQDPAGAAGASPPTAGKRWARRCTCASITSPTSTPPTQRLPDLLRQRQRSHDKRIYAPSLSYPALLTVKIAAATLVLHFLLGIGLGWALSRPRWPGRTLVDLLVTLPLVFPPLALGFFLLLATARSLGEVGITLMLGGNIVGRTNTMSLEIYNSVFNGEYPRAIALSTILGLASLIVFVAMRRSARPVLT